MRLSTGLVVSAVLVWGGLVAAAYGGHQSPAARPSSQGSDARQPSTVSEGAPASDYLGSAACRRCHEAEQDQWERSLHIRMTKPVEQAIVVGDFTDGRRFSDHGRSYVFGHKGGKPTVTVSFGDRAPETFVVDYTLGAKRYQGYLSTLPDGRIYVLPVFWHVENRRWLDWKELTPIPEGAHDIRQIWNSNCFNCHGTNIVQGYDVEAGRYNSAWTEMGIGCEACHGPGREHVAVAERWEKDPASKPAYDDSSENRQLTDLLKVLSTRSAEPRRTFDTCAYCHGNKNNVFVGFRAGDRYEDFALPFLLSEDIPVNDLQGEFWPDGRPDRFNRPQALTLSGCFKAGAITCTNCHVAHGSGNEHSLKVNIYEGRNGDTLCTQCHTTPKIVPAARREDAALVAASDQTVPARTVSVPASFTGDGLEAHTFHRPDSEGSRCIACHMSDVNWRLLTRRRDHTFIPPTPEVTSGYGVPNACTTCHDDRTPEWASAQMDAWWGDTERRASERHIADVMYRAGSGDETVLPELVSLALDRGQGMLRRASAADYIARMLLGAGRVGTAVQSQTSLGTGKVAIQRSPLPPEAVTPSLVNAMIGVASDPEPTVRAAAVQALGATRQLGRVAPALTARLQDEARIVRVRAVEALLALGVVRLPGPAGQALARAQDDYVLSLEQFPDVASNHAMLGWFEAERGNVEAAEKALDDAIRVDPNFARPYVVKGVLSARAGRFQEAIDLWRKAKSIDASYPRISELIAEAEKRKAGAR